jgi:hypothetical protein
VDSKEYWRRRDYGADLGDMIQDNYGTCTNPLERCACLAPRRPWLGRGCRWWQPVRARTYAELRAELYGG